ncbi:AbrB family transcriptional regulator [Aurantimonas sp. A2-1-M11]|uniref:AbrB family transcriptional regulator n=1 Tax=Aurantimonas sp. A2-1-M11 TaxID=3113712 RepID=UPI002F93D2B0
MTDDVLARAPDAATPGRRPPAAIQWLALLALSILIGGALELVGMPAAMLLGPMIAAILLAVRGTSIAVSPVPYSAAQAAIGCLVAAAITPQILSTFLLDWPLYVGVVLAVIAASSVLGGLMSRWHVLPGTTAVWGTSPGAATAMVVMADAFGADARLVGFMQYLRVILVAIAAALMARFWISDDAPAATAQVAVWFPTLVWEHFGPTLAFVGLGVLVGRFLAIPAGPLLVPMAIGVALNLAGYVEFQLPEWFLVLGYGVLGWKIGLGFDRAVLAHAWHALPRIVGSILILMTFCAGLAALLHVGLGIDPVTAYLATSPGGMDSIAIIAASTRVDLPFVMALQTVRFVIVLVAGPPIARFVARRFGVRD